MLASRFLRPSAQAHHGRFYAQSERVFQGLLGVYRRALGWSIRHRRFTLGYSAVILALTVFLFMHVPKGFLESEDTGQLSGSTEAQEGISFDAMVEN